MAWKFHKHSLDIRCNKSSQEAEWMCCCVRGEKCSHGGVLNSIRRHINTPAPPLLITCLICSKWDGWIGFGDEIAAPRVAVLQKCPRPAGTGLVTTSINMKPEKTNSPRWDPESSSCDRREAVCVNRCFAAAYFSSSEVLPTPWQQQAGQTSEVSTVDVLKPHRTEQKRQFCGFE